MASVHNNAVRLHNHLSTGGRMGYWQKRRVVEKRTAMTRCQMSAAVKYLRDDLAKVLGAPPLVTTLKGEIAYAQTPQMYRRSRLWEFSYNASRVRTASRNAQRAATRFSGQANAAILDDDVKLLRMAEFMLQQLHEGRSTVTDAQIVRATTRILALGAKEARPRMEDLFA